MRYAYICGVAWSRRFSRSVVARRRPLLLQLRDHQLDVLLFQGRVAQLDGVAIAVRRAVCGLAGEDARARAAVAIAPLGTSKPQKEPRLSGDRVAVDLHAHVEVLGAQRLQLHVLHRRRVVEVHRDGLPPLGGRRLKGFEPLRQAVLVLRVEVTQLAALAGQRVGIQHEAEGLVGLVLHSLKSNSRR